MPRQDTNLRLRHMLDAAREAVQMAQGKTRVALDTDRPLNLSLVWLLSIVGERYNDDDRSLPSKRISKWETCKSRW